MTKPNSPGPSYAKKVPPTTSSSNSSSKPAHRKYASKCVVEQGIRKCLVQVAIKEQNKARKLDPYGRLPNHFMSNLVERFKIVIPSLTVKSLSNSVVDEKRKQERRKRKECIELYGSDCIMTPMKKPRCVKSELVVVPVAEMLNYPTTPCRVSDSPPEVVLQQALFLNGKCYSVKDDDSCVSSLSSRSSTFHNYTPSSSSIIKAVTPTDPNEAIDCNLEGKEENGQDETHVDNDVAANGERKCHAGQEKSKNVKNDKSAVDDEIKRDADDLLYATRNAKYDLTMKVIERKKQDPYDIITHDEFAKMIFDSLSKNKLPVLTLLNMEDIFTTIQDNEEFTTSQEKEIILANQYPVRNELWGESDEYRRAFRIEKAKAANEITRLIYERMVNRSGDITKHISMKEFREIVHHVRMTHELPDDMVFDKKYFNRRIKQRILIRRVVLRREESCLGNWLVGRRERLVPIVL